MRHVKHASILSGLAGAAACLALVGCATPYQPVETPQGITEVIREIDAYRGDGQRRTLDHTFSQDATMLGLGDTPTTAGRQSSGPVCRIQMADVLLTTLKNNRNLKIGEYNRSIAQEGVEAARGIYDLLIQSSYEHSRNKVQGPSYDGTGFGQNDLAVSNSRQDQAGLTLGQLFPSGGILSLYAQYGNQKNWSGPTAFNPAPIDPYDSLATGLSFVQPLLRGFGPSITNAPIQVAYLQQEIAREEFRDQVIQQLTQSVNLYWELVFAIDNYEVQRLSLGRARELLRITVIKRDTGVEAPNVVLQAEAEVSRREALLIDAQRTISDASDRLKGAMNLSRTSEEWNYNLIPVDRPSFAPVNLNEEAVYREALELRPDYRSARFGVNLAAIDQRVAANAKLPQLDAVAGYRYTGGGDTPGNALDSLAEQDYHGWNAGLHFQYPLQNRRAAATYRQKTTALDKSNESVENIKEMIRLDVRTAIRALETNLKLISAYDATVQSEAAKLDAQIKRFEVGFATIFEVLTFQEDLATAQSNYLRAIVNYNKALIEVQRVKASFLQDYRVQFLDRPVQERAAREQKANGDLLKTP